MTSYKGDYEKGKYEKADYKDGDDDDDKDMDKAGHMMAKPGMHMQGRMMGKAGAMTGSSGMHVPNTRPGGAMDKGGYGGGYGGQKDGTSQKDSTDDETKRDKADMMGKSVDAASLDATIGLLEKSLRNDPGARQQELLAKGASEGLTDDESEELRKSLGGEDYSGSADLEDRMQAALHADEELTKSIQLDVGGALAGLHTGIVEALTELGAEMRKSASAVEDREFVMMKAMLDLSKVAQAQAQKIDELEKSLGSWGRQPVRGRKSYSDAGAVGQLQGAGNGGGLNRQQQIDVLGEMLKAETDPSRADQLFHAATALEATGMPLSKSLENEISRFVAESAGRR